MKKIIGWILMSLPFIFLLIGLAITNTLAFLKAMGFIVVAIFIMAIGFKLVDD